MGRLEGEKSRTAEEKRFKLTLFENTLSTVHAVRGNIADHSSTTSCRGALTSSTLIDSSKNLR